MAAAEKLASSSTAHSISHVAFATSRPTESRNRSEWETCEEEAEQSFRRHESNRGKDTRDA
jgi:hypothetical protein